METAAPEQEDQDQARYALWLVPQNEAEQRFVSVIETLSSQHNCPRFAPHVTLVSGLADPEQDLIDKTENLAREMEQIPVTATGFAMEPYYFKSFYLKLDPSAALLLAYQRATQSFSTSAESYAPHVSLLYGSVARDTKIAMGNEVHQQVPASFNLDRLYLVHLSLAVPNWTIVSRHDLKSAS